MNRISGYSRLNLRRKYKRKNEKTDRYSKGSEHGIISKSQSSNDSRTAIFNQRDNPTLCESMATKKKKKKVGNQGKTKWGGGTIYPRKEEKVS